MTTLSAHVTGKLAHLVATGPRGGMNYIGDMTAAELRKASQALDAARDMLTAAALGHRAVRCVCTDSEGHGSLRCNGIGDSIDNLGYCAGCYSDELGTVGSSHVPTPGPLPR